MSDGRQYLLRLYWPPGALWQNSRPHWAAQREAARKARMAAFLTAKSQSVACMPTALLAFEFHPPDRRARDLQNMPATQKAAIDGIADAMGCDDKHFRVQWPTEWGEVVKGGCVMVHIREDKEKPPEP